MLCSIVLMYSGYHGRRLANDRSERGRAVRSSARFATLLDPLPLRLVTGPANAAKAGVVLDACRAAAAREPLLVVPTVADVETYRRELAVGGAVLGVRVETFRGLLRELARRAGVRGDPLGPLA